MPDIRELPAPALENNVQAAEAALGVRLPFDLRRVYTEVADGGFGPGEGMLSVARVVEVYRELRTNGQLPRGRS